ncbi:MULTISPECIES: 50S ribosomal protein L30 [unclassified Pseudoclavibacter]|uniref:50S ribosomal protein L30 n=1 Tax=unclassified Pseudoclavibacter TaxID=2615177 RepID=UPI0013017909|nr:MULTISPECIES: 50S ribosomal protein L30 [unclassified Pseudoclavibacter]KAB1644357.1 50S ribosomal protein L30 [Pseudoclavibacter sp. CFCC 14310]KAB1658931.1 50S ribosomal protein L30 [Pseudoclavibacter sp. CFCC 11306]KAB1661036.1 50S ribosomal protein L30 [Pseudoclavibacter sp. CFCC 13796]KAB1664141.1 50S ribosomal protein L30 [Pseudoclavibacter sp. CFCC 13611]
MASQLKVTQVKSKYGARPEQRDTLRSLGLRRIGQTVIKDDNQVNRGYVNAVRHLIKVEEI